ncbi:monooxygenase [Reticulomyxa filosa]|uniref:Monooxygenase n=1 Tax=Reticulomyxa filosa TaxID=46433 RepID=X6MYV1_RETFI|nr:monooxygenase [Reticulomyxa filosa]|eukprot:ETO18808.1 monooxygenase [Reticulomyxa filosa]
MQATGIINNSAARSSLHALIIGGGPAGLFTALALREKGISSTILEKEKEIHTTQNASSEGSFVLNGALYCLAYLNEGKYLQQFLDLHISNRYSSIEYKDHRSKPVIHMNPCDIAQSLSFHPPMDIRVVRRSDLTEFLSNLCRNDPKFQKLSKRNTNQNTANKAYIEFQCNKEFTHYDTPRQSSSSSSSSSLSLSSSTRQNQICAYFKDGTKMMGDILIGCDGIHSNVRKCLHENEWVGAMQQAALDKEKAEEYFGKVPANERADTTSTAVDEDPLLVQSQDTSKIQSPSFMWYFTGYYLSLYQ